MHFIFFFGLNQVIIVCQPIVKTLFEASTVNCFVQCWSQFDSSNNLKIQYDVVFDSEFGFNLDFETILIYD